MADINNVDNVVAAAGGGEGIFQPQYGPYTTYVDTLIEEVTPNKPKEKKFSVKFDNFEELPSVRGHVVKSSKFSCFGHEWCLYIYPGGNPVRGNRCKGMAGVYLNRVEKFGKRLNLEMKIGVKSEDDVEFKANVEFGRLQQTGWGWDYFPARSILLEEFLEEGALTIYVSLRLQEFIPNNPASSIMLKLFGDEKSADVVFEISENQIPDSENESRKRAKISSANFYAHYSATAFVRTCSSMCYVGRNGSYPHH